MFCADANPWDASILCELLLGHAATPENPRGHLHESEGIRWSDRCHFAGDDCPPATHATLEAAR